MCLDYGEEFFGVPAEAFVVTDAFPCYGPLGRSNLGMSLSDASTHQSMDEQ